MNLLGGNGIVRWLASPAELDSVPPDPTAVWRVDKPRAKLDALCTRLLFTWDDMGVSLAGGGSGWTVVEPPSWCRNDLLVLLELVPERPSWIVDGPPRELEEALGIELWRAVANIRLWAETPDSDRSELFQRVRSANSFPRELAPPDPVRQRLADASTLEPGLGSALETFAALVQAPEGVTVPEIVSACRQVVSWAENRGFAETAMQFAEAAAAADPRNPVLANLAGRLCRNYGKRGRAELWYDRAIGLSRRMPGKAGVREYIHAHLGFATTLLEIEDHARALNYIKRAGFMAKRKGMRAKAAEAFHDAMYLATVDGSLGRATVYARKAINLYPYHHPRLPALAHDFALLLVYKGMYPPALSILRAVVRKIPRRADEVVVWGTIARAAAGAGIIKTFRQAVEIVDATAPMFGQSGAAALYSVAEGARTLRDWPTSQTYAQAAATLARTTGSQQVLSLSTKLLAEIDDCRLGVAKLPKGNPSGTLLRHLAPVVRLRVAKWRGPTWRPRRLGPGAVTDV